MEFITSGNRIAVENFTTGKLYTVLWKNDTQENLMCISIGADCVVFQGEAPINLYTLSMRNADTIDSIEPTQLGTTNYNNLINKPQINGVDLIGNKTDEQLGLVSQLDLEDYATNASVVAGLATKQDALSSSQLSAVNSGITSELVTQIGTNENNILTVANQSTVYNAAQTNTKTFTRDTYINCIMQGNTAYRIYCSSFVSTSTDLSGQIIFYDGNDTNVGQSALAFGTNTYIEFTPTTDVAKIRLYSALGGTSSEGQTATITELSVTPKSLYDAGFTAFQPGAMSNAEITAWILAHS